MNKTLIILPILISSFSQLSAKSNKIVDCRLITPSTTECKPYSTKFLRTKKIIDYDKNSKLIIVKNLPLPTPKKRKMEVISVEDMIEKYVRIHDPIRFSSQYTNEELKIIERIHQKELKAKEYPLYKVKKGDSIYKISKIYRITVNDILEWNNIKDISLLKKNQQIIIPIDKKSFKSLTKKYKQKIVKRKREIKRKRKLALERRLKRKRELEEKRKLALKKKLALELKKKKAKLLYPKKTKKLLHYGNRGRYKRKLRVMATAYTSHRRQTDKTPFLAAWNNKLRIGEKSIAVSRDLLRKYGIKNKQRVKISGLSGYYIVKDKMNRRFRKRIDIYMGLNRRKALRWGRKHVTIYW